MTDLVRFDATAAMPPGDIVAAHDGQFVVRKGKLFESGAYPDKRFAITAEEQRAAAARFSPFDLKDTHVESVFNGKLGTVGEVWTSEDGSELFGTVVIPKWMDTLFANETLPLSTEWDTRNKDLKGLVLVPTPRVTDAALLAAFSADFASKRHNAADQTQVQAIHDAAAALGAACGSETANMAGARHSGVDTELVQRVHDTAQALGAECSGKGTATMTATTISSEEQAQAVSVWQAIKAVFTGSDPANPPKPAAAAPVATFSAGDDPTLKALQAEVAQLKADKVAMLAAAFADEFIGEKRALPAERASMMALFSQAYADDAAHPSLVFFGVNADGTDRTGSRVDALRATYQAKAPHLLTDELLRDNPALSGDELRVVFAAATAPTDATLPTPEGKTPSAERLAALKRHIPGAAD